MSQSEMMQAKGFLLAAEVARRAGKDLSTIYRWIKTGKIKAVHVEGRFWFLEESSVAAFLGPAWPAPGVPPAE